MKPTGSWLGCLAMAGSCLVWAGCGGGDVPNPESDSRAAVESPPKTVNGAAVAEAAAAATPEPAPVAPASPAEPAPKPVAATAAAPASEPESAPRVAAAKPAGEPATSPAEAAASPAEAATGTAKADTSGTDEMLRIAGSPPPAPAGGTATPSAGSAAPAPAVAAAPAGDASPRGMVGRPGGPESRAADPSAAAPPAVPRRSGDEMAASVERPGATGAGGNAAARSGGGGMMAGEAGGGSFGAATGSGGAGNEPDGGPRAFLNPGTAVQAFLSALKAKNKDRLSQATARRAATEAAEKHRKIFAAILEQSISDEELDDMAKALEGYQVVDILPARSTGQIGVTIGRQTNRELLQRTVQVRKEKEGWKVMDFGATMDFRPVGSGRVPTGRRR